MPLPSHCKPCCFLGRGEFSLKPHISCCVVGAAPVEFISLGNVSKGEVGIKSTEVKQMRYLDASGGVDCVVSIPEEVTLALTLHCTNPEALKVYAAATGAANNMPAAASQTQAYTVVSGNDLIPLDGLPDRATAPTITGLAFGTDFSWSTNGTGIKLLGTAAALALANTAISIGYNAISATNLQILTAVSQKWELWYDGVNAADGKRVQVRLHKVNVSQAQKLPLIGTNQFASYDLTITAMADDCVTAVPLMPGFAPSKFGQIIQES